MIGKMPQQTNCMVTVARNLNVGKMPQQTAWQQAILKPVASLEMAPHTGKMPVGTMYPGGIYKTRVP